MRRVSDVNIAGARAGCSRGWDGDVGSGCDSGGSTQKMQKGGEGSGAGISWAGEWKAGAGRAGGSGEEVWTGQAGWSAGTVTREW